VTASRLVVAVCVAVVAAQAGDVARADSFTFAPRVAAANASQVSTNWSGYVAVAPTSEAATSPDLTLTFSDVTASWVQPKARCVKGRSDAAAFWVGLGGFNEDSPALEQLGTTAQCSSRGVATYFAWWEIIPAAAIQVPMKLRPGDRVTAAVLVKGQKVTMSLTNATRKTRFSKVMTVSQPLDVSSAEWIAEAPSACTASGSCEVVSLTNFGSVTFKNAYATANGVTGTITDSAWLATPVWLITDQSAGGFGAVPGAPSSDGRSFLISWQREVQARAIDGG
jgi:hypothetical protein